MQGFSLLEVLVVLTVFSLIAIIATQSIILTLRGARKSEATTKVRQNVDYALSVIERTLHSAKSVTCPNPDPSVINFVNADGVASSFSCITAGSDKYMASGSARLTGSDIQVTSCSLSCSSPAGSPSSVTVNITASDMASGSTVEGSVLTTSTQIYLRTY